MQIPKKVVETVTATTVRVHAKVSDSGSYALLDADGTESSPASMITCRDFFPRTTTAII